MRQGRSILLIGFCFSAGVRATLPQHGFQDVDGMKKAYHFSKYVQGRLFSLQSLIPSWGGLCTKQIYWKGSGDCRIVENNKQQRRMTPSWPSPRSPLSFPRRVSSPSARRAPPRARRTSKGCSATGRRRSGPRRVRAENTFLKFDGNYHCLSCQCMEQMERGPME